MGKPVFFRNAAPVDGPTSIHIPQVLKFLKKKHMKLGKNERGIGKEWREEKRGFDQNTYAYMNIK